jgi:gliding motility-associated-like protein
VAAPYTLLGSPGSGTYTGPGVAGSVFDPAVAGLGQHTISYGLKPAPECITVSTSQSLTVHPVPTIALSTTLLTFKGNSFTLQPTFTGDPVRFGWLPDDWLRDAQTPTASIENIQAPVTYTLRVENAGNCSTTAAIAIDVIDRIYAPDIFTPNGDGNNDRWRLVNAEAFPDLDVLVFNRWGTVIYHAVGVDQPQFDGTQNGTQLPEGIYTYLIRCAPQFAPLQGRLFLAR